MQPVVLVTGGGTRRGAAVARLAAALTAVPAGNEHGPLPAVRTAAAHVAGAIGSGSGAR